MSTDRPPRVSIVIPAFNSAASVSDAVGSVLAQTDGDWEAIVVDDGSSDRTAQIAESAAGGDPRIRILRQPNGGTAAARNAGAEITRGEWLLFLDADDILLPEYLERQMEFSSANPGYDIYSCNAYIETPEGNRSRFWSGARSLRIHSLSAADQIAESSILIMSLVQRALFDRVGGFRTLHSEDYDFWLRALLAGGRHIYNPAILAVYRRHEGQKTRALVEEARSFLWILEDAAQRPELTQQERDALEAATIVARARIDRRALEESLLAGRFEGARSAYWRSRRAFPHAAKYVLGMVVMLVSPRLYATIKSARMI